MIQPVIGQRRKTTKENNSLTDIKLTTSTYLIFADLPVNITTPVIQRSRQAVDTLLDDVRGLGPSKFVLIKNYLFRSSRKTHVK